MSRTIVLVFTSRIKVKNIIVLVATSSVKILSISRLLGSKVLPTVAATHACTRTCQPRSHANAIFSLQGMGRATHIGNIHLPTSAHKAGGLTLALYVPDRPTEAQKHLGGTAQQEVTNASVKSRGPHEPATGIQVNKH